MTICNMTIEWGARAGMIAPDETTFAYLEGRPTGAAGGRVGARARPLALARLRSRRDVRHARRRRRGGARSAGDVGNEPGHGRSRHGHRARPRRLRRSRRPCGRRARARVHGASAGRADRGHRDRPRLHRLLHELADRGSPRRGRDRRRPEGRYRRDGARRPRLGAGAAPGGGGGPRSDLPRRRLRVAPRRLLDVPGDEPRLRAAGERCASTSNRNFEGRQGVGGRTHLVSPRWPPRRRSTATSSTSGSSRSPREGDPSTRAASRCSTGPTSTPTRSSPSSS